MQLLLTLYCNDVVITNERINHIKSHHPEIIEKELDYIKNILLEPEYIFEDRKNKDTLLIVKSICECNKFYKIVVKLNTNVTLKCINNSIISFWHIGNKKLNQYKRNEKMIFPKLDKSE